MFSFRDINHSIEEYIDFMKNIGLFDIFQKNLIKNLRDYVFGVEVGLDSHRRKNRVGITMEKLVEKYIIESGFIKNKTYFKNIDLVDFV